MAWLELRHETLLRPSACAAVAILRDWKSKVAPDKGRPPILYDIELRSAGAEIGVTERDALQVSACHALDAIDVFYVLYSFDGNFSVPVWVPCTSVDADFTSHDASRTNVNERVTPPSLSSDDS